MNNIYITGFMSSGKTVVSSELSRITGKGLMDTDDMIEKSLNMKIKDIFSEKGEEYFRKVESETLLRASVADGAIISTGGGIVLSGYNRSIMHKTGIIATLLPDFSVIEERLELARATRPLLMEDISLIRKRFEDRLPLYKDCDFEIPVDNSMTPEDVAREIIKRIDV